MPWCCAWASPFRACCCQPVIPPFFWFSLLSKFFLLLLSPLPHPSICLFSTRFLFTFPFHSFSFSFVVSWDRVFTPSPRPSTLSFIQFSCSQPRSDDSSGLPFVLPTRSLPPTASKALTATLRHCSIIIIIFIFTIQSKDLLAGSGIIDFLFSSRDYPSTLLRVVVFTIQLPGSAVVPSRTISPNSSPTFRFPLSLIRHILHCSSGAPPSIVHFDHGP